MKWTGLLSCLLLPSATATPALVWRSNGEGSVPMHTSEDISAEALLQAPSDDYLQVVFVVGRQPDGGETLSTWTAEGTLPKVADAADRATAVHHSVSNVQSATALTNFARNVDRTALQVTLDEFRSRMERQSRELQVAVDGQVLSKSAQKANKRTLALEAATTLVVDVPATTVPSILDKAVADAIASRQAHVVLTAVRSVEEVKTERSRLARERIARMAHATTPTHSTANRRRLEDAQQNNYNVNQEREGQQDLGGIYYVSMTPNILAGLLFFFLFTFTTYVGVSCMGMIAGQDVYVKKMPAIGREA